MNEETLDHNEITTTKTTFWKWLRVIERISVVLVVIGFLFKTMHWKWGVELVMFPSLILSFTYLIFFASLVSAKSKKKAGLVLSIVSGFIISTTVLIILFRIMLWPGFGDLVGIGYVCLVIALVYLAFYIKKIIVSKTFIRAAFRLVLVGGVAIFLHLVSIRQQINFYYDHMASDNMLDAFMDQYHNPDDDGFRERYDKLRKQHSDSTVALMNGDTYPNNKD
ncbi:MAG: hypothetical protein ACI9JN_000568 [Bacteroidia bacterium]|jgi:hypothetical protein